MPFGRLSRRPCGAAQAVIKTPSGLTLLLTEEITVDITWTDNATEGYILIERAFQRASGWAELASVAVGVQNYVDDTVTAGQWFYRIRAYYLPKGYSSYTGHQSVLVAD